MSLQSSNLSIMYPTPNIGSGAALVSQFYARGSYPAMLTAGTRSLGSVIELGQPNGERDRSVQLTGLHTDSANNTVHTLNLFAIDAISKSVRADRILGLSVALIATVVATTGSGTTDGVLAPSGRRYIDTLVPTLTAYGTAMLGSLGVEITAHSPPDNTPASLFVPDLGGVYGMFLQVENSGHSLNGFVRRFT